MPDITVSIPDAVLADLTEAVAQRVTDAPEPAVQAVLVKIANSQATSNAEKVGLVRYWIRREGRAALSNWRSQRASEAARQATDQEWAP